MPKGQGVYEIHTMALKHGRGPKLRERVKDMLKYAFEFAKAERLESMAFVDNQPAVKLAEEFMTLDREDAGIKYYFMTAEDYKSRSY